MWKLFVGVYHSASYLENISPYELTYDISSSMNDNDCIAIPRLAKIVFLSHIPNHDYYPSASTRRFSLTLFVKVGGG